MTGPLRQIYRSLLNIQCNQLQYRRLLQTTGMRCLFSADTLGLENFKRQQSTTKDKIGDLQEVFRKRMNEYMESEKNTIFTGDLKNMIYAATSAGDLETTKTMIERFRDQRGELRFSTFVFGPIIMRMCHLLNQPDLALILFNDPRTADGFFDQMSTFMVLMDQLFESGRHDDVLAVMDVVVERQIGGHKYPSDCLTLACATCCKLNTPEAYAYLLKMMEGVRASGTNTSLRALMFAAHLALQQNDPKGAMEILDSKTDFKGVPPIGYTNMKVLVLTALGRLDDAMMELRGLLNEDVPESRVSNVNVFPDVLSTLLTAVEASTDPELKQRFEELRKGLLERGQIHKMLFNDYIFCPIERKRLQQDSFKSRRRSGAMGYSGSRQSRSRPGLRQWEDQAAN